MQTRPRPSPRESTEAMVRNICRELGQIEPPEAGDQAPDASLG
jgi:hypothetical protein